MGEPLAFGPVNNIDSYLSGANNLKICLKEQKNFLLYYYKHDESTKGGWKKTDLVPLKGYKLNVAEKQASNVDRFELIPTLKKTDYDIDETILFYFELSSSNCLLYDHRMGTPITRCNRSTMIMNVNKISEKLTKIPTVCYFKLDTKNSWKCFSVYKPINNGTKHITAEAEKSDLKYKKDQDEIKT